MSSAFGASLPHGRRGAARMLSVSVAALCAGVGLRARWRQVETTPHSTRYPVEPPSEATNAATGAKTPFSTRSDVAAVATRETGTEGEQKDACDCAPLWNCMISGGDCNALDAELRACLASSRVVSQP
jgi:hypothetical protein